MSPSSSAPVGVARNLADLVTEAARRDPAHPAVIEVTSGREWTWGQFDAVVDGAATRLIEHGLRPGQRVLLRMPTSAAFCWSLFGILRAGGVAVPVGTGATGRELDRVLDGCGANLLIAAPDDVDAEAAAGRSGATRLDPTPADAARPAHESGPGGSPAGGEALAVLAFTSGTTGHPRGVMLSHRALLANVEQCAAMRPAPMNAADRVLLSLPLFHSYALGPGLFQVANTAATAVLTERFDPEEALQAVHRYRVTVVVGVPPMYQAWLRLPPDRLAEGMRTMRLFSSGAAPLPPSVLVGMREATGLAVFEGYGLAEAGPVVTSMLVGGVVKPGSVGRPLPGVPSRGLDPVELRLVDAGGRPLPTGDDEDAGGTGVIAIRGPNLFSGYWPDGAFGPAELPGLGPGWIRTGDVGYLDVDGDLYLVDRADDLIIVNGFNVYPREVEDVLCEHPGVRQAAVIGMPHPRTGEAVRAVLVPAEGQQPSAEEIVEHCAARLPRFKVPVEVALVASLPQLPTGKLARRMLREGVDVVRVPPDE